MTIETRIAKNGTKMYYVRDNETGKLSRISRDKAKDVNMNNIIESLGKHVGFVNTGNEATCILCVTVKDEFSNGDFGHGMYFDTADNAVNAARTIATHDNFICAYVMGDAKHFHNKRLFTINTDKTEEFTEAYCEFKLATAEENRFMVTAYYSYTDAQGRNWNGMDEGQCATAQAAAEWFIDFANEHPDYIIKTMSDTCIHGKTMSDIYDRKTRKEYGLTDADTAALKPTIVEKATIETVIECKTTSNNNTVVKLNGKRANMVDAQYAICGHDCQTNSVKIVDELGEVFIGGIDRVNNVYIFERQTGQDCGQVFEMPLSTNPIRLIAWRNLADYRETPAPVKPETSIELSKPGNPCAIANGLDGVFQGVVKGISYMDVTTQGGTHIVTCFGNAYIEPDWSNDDGYVFTNGIDTFARYDTPEQVIDAVTALRDAIKRGETQFTFPTANQPAEPKVEKTMHTTVGDDVQYIATQITYPTGHEGEPTREVSKTFHYLDDAARFIADDNPFIESENGGTHFAYADYYFGGVYWAGWKIEATDGRLICHADTDGVYGDQNICELVDKHIDAHDKFAIDSVQIEDSLTRAMNTALEHYKGFCHIGNLTAAEHELKLYNICRKATRELWEE